ncbi:MAG: hypothetical protein LBM93_02530 [Oscillospiraceae bacterium]|jgi:hypothetical protein|nr:hypothetical protein [Oscillospiraceae bacterium]
MEMNKVLTNDEVIETTEEIVEVVPEKGSKLALKVGLGVLGSVIAYKCIIKPIIKKIKNRKETEELNRYEPDNVFYFDSEEAEIDSEPKEEKTE